MSLNHYDGKTIRVTTTDGLVLEGAAEAFPSGYGLHEFGREEESLCIGGTMVFWSEIESLEVADGAATAAESYDEAAEKLLERPYWIVDILPARVPADVGGQYFAVERYFLQPERRAALYETYGEMLLKLSCYGDMAVSFDGLTWEVNPAPEAFVQRVRGLSGGNFLRVLLPRENAMLELDAGDTYLTVYDPPPALLELMKKLATGQGLFLWPDREA